MAERATVFETTQIGVETTPGTAVSADKRLLAIGIEPAIKVSSKLVNPRGHKYASGVIIGKEWVEAKIAGEASYGDLAYLLASIANYAAPTQITPTTGMAYQWTFTPNNTDVDTAKTFTIEAGSSVHAMKFANGILSEFGYKLTRDEFSISGTMLGQRITDGITMTASPTDVELVTINPNTVDVYADSASSGLGTTALTRVLSVDWKLSSKVGPVWPLVSADNSFAATVELMPKPELKIMVEADADGMAFLTDMRAGDKTFLRIEAVGSLIETGNSYTFTHDISAEVKDVGAFSDDSGVYAVEFTFEPVYDSTYTKTYEFGLINQISAL